MQPRFLPEVFHFHCSCSDRDNFVDSALFPHSTSFILSVFVCLDLVWDVEGGHSTIITTYSGSGSISNPDK